MTYFNIQINQFFPIFDKSIGLNLPIDVLFHTFTATCFLCGNDWRHLMVLSALAPVGDR